MIGPSEKTISIVIPCYNDTDALPGVLRELKQQLLTVPGGFAWEIVVVDDCSDKPVADILAECDDLQEMSVFRHPVNRGYGASIKTGIHQSDGEFIMTMDADGQHDPACIPQLVKDAELFDLTVGQRENSSGVPLMRRPGKWLLSKLIDYVLGCKIPDMNSGIRIMNRKKIVRYMRLCSDRFSFSTSSTMAFISERDLVRFIPIKCRHRAGGPSKIGPATAMETLLKIIRMGVVFKPLRLFLPLALLCLGIGFSSLVYDLWNKDLHDLTVISLLFGTLIFCFGLISDQIAALRRESQ